MVIELRLECLWLEVVGVEVHGRKYGFLDLGIDRDRRVESIELVPRSQSRDSKSGLGVEMFLVWVLHLHIESRGMRSKHRHVELLAGKPRCVYERFATDMLTERVKGNAEYVPSS